MSSNFIRLSFRSETFETTTENLNSRYRSTSRS